MNNKLDKLNVLLFGIMSLFSILAFLIFIFSNKISSEHIQKFFFAYIVSLIAFLSYILISTCIKMKNLDKEEFNHRIIGFIKHFVFSTLILSLTSIFLKLNHFDLFKMIYISLAYAFGTNFLDLFFKKNIKSKYL